MHTTTRKRKQKGQKRNFFDLMVYPAAILLSVMTLPQLYEIWVNKSIEGLSLITWGSYAVISFLWLMYGIHHKEKPVILSNFLICILDILIVVGALTVR